ncbi:MAG: Spx/MgsR family RNA polymerase-binding regulatory protein [Planctomycetes bacterium]|nr:Spx/MgsR family RNA polymerase-binding regulatory protein [Planctomycetota bacterium]
MLRIYVYDGCSTCRSALKWLDGRGIRYTAVPIRERPPTPSELRRMLAHAGGQVKSLFNRSGKDYREQGLATRLPEMSDAQALALLAANGDLVKRPFALDEDEGAVGFDAERWTTLFAH